MLQKSLAAVLASVKSNVPLITNMLSRGLVGSVSIERHEGVPTLRFEFRLGRQPVKNREHSFFVALSSKQVAVLDEIRRTRQSHEPIGHATLEIHPENEIHWTDFYPLGRAQYQRVHRKGIGSLAHHGVIEYVAKKFPNHSIAHSAVMPRERMQHILAMGIRLGQTYPMKKYLEIVRNYIARRRK